MMHNPSNTNSQQKCFQCGSALIFVSQETVQPEGARYPQTNTVYRCSNEECQKKKDKEKADRQKLKESREMHARERIERIRQQGGRVKS